ncbi:MAG: insulinase family protein [Calditrichaeota bacterium]|nr:MAG: insulinase family protein [Calditrichota bacterium]
MEQKHTHINKSILSNGIRIVTEKIPHVRSVSFGIWLEVGSRNENSTNNGVSHFIEHMLFKGTKKRSAFQIAESIENVGGHLNAFTSKDLTCYYAHILDEHLPLAIDVLADILQESLFNESEIKKEQEVVLEEIRASEEVPEERIHDYFFADLFRPHPLGFPTLGTEQTVKSFDQNMLLEYFHKNYTGNRIVIAAAGNLHHPEICDLIEKKFSALVKAPKLPMAKPLKSQQIKQKYIEDSLQAHVCLGTTTIEYSNKMKYPLLVLNTLLGGGMSSRLFQKVREKHGLCYNIYSYLEFFVDSGVFCIYTGTEQGKVAKSLELIIKELDNLKENSILDEELERTKSQLKGNLLLSLESTSNRMNRLAKMEIYMKKNISLDDISKGLNNVTAQEIQLQAKKLFDFERLVQSILLPVN